MAIFKVKIHWIFLILIVFIMGQYCDSQSKSLSKKEDALQQPETDIYSQWLKQKKEEIIISDETAGEAALTRNIYFIFDGSGSMNDRTNHNCGGDQNFERKIDGAKWALKTFLERIPEDVYIGLYVFDSVGSREVLPIQALDRQRLIREIEAIKAGGGTPLAQAITAGTDRLVERYKEQLGYGEFRLVVITDGLADEIPMAALHAAKYGIPIYTIGLCVGSNHPLRNFSLSYRAADSFSDLSQGLEETIAELPDLDIADFQEIPDAQN
jgi:hypothetical protein